MLCLALFACPCVSARRQASWREQTVLAAVWARDPTRFSRKDRQGRKDEQGGFQGDEVVTGSSGPGMKRPTSSLSVGEPKAAVDTDTGEGVIVRYNEAKNEVVGLLGDAVDGVE